MRTNSRKCQFSVGARAQLAATIKLEKNFNIICFIDDKKFAGKPVQYQ